MKIGENTMQGLGNHLVNGPQDGRRKTRAGISKGLGAAMVAAGLFFLSIEAIPPLFLLIWLACAVLVLLDFKREEKKQLEELARGNSLDRYSEPLHGEKSVTEKDDTEPRPDVLPLWESASGSNHVLYI